MESEAPKVEYYSWQKVSDWPLLFRRWRRVRKSKMGRNSLMAWRKAPHHLTFPSPKLPGKGLSSQMCLCTCEGKEWQRCWLYHAETRRLGRGSPANTVFDMPGHVKDSSLLEFREHALIWSETRAVHGHNVESFRCLPDRNASASVWVHIMAMVATLNVFPLRGH